MSNSFTTITVQHFINMLKVFSVDFDVCDINKKSSIAENYKRIRLKNPRIQDKNSSSPTTIQFGELVAGIVGQRMELPVAMKIFRNIDSPQISGLKYEAKVYKQIFEDIIEQKYSPNFISYVGFGCCEKENSCLLITETAGNGAQFSKPQLFPVYTLYNLYPSINDREKAKTLLQIIYSIELLNILRIVHNDLHINNILVADFGEENKIPMIFMAKGKIFQINARFVPYLFDWDRSYSEKLGPNPRIEEEKSGFITNEFNPYRDLYTVFCNLTILSTGPSFISRYTGNEITKKKETGQSVMILSKREVDKIDELDKSIYSRIDNNHIVYKLSRAEFNEIVKNSDQRGLPKDIDTIYFEILLDEKNKNHLVLWNPLTCRLTANSSQFPTSAELLREEFSMFEISRETYKSLNFDKYFRYRMPLPEQSRTNDDLIEFMKTI